MASFDDELEKAAQNLRDLNTQLSRLTGGGGAGASSSGGGAGSGVGGALGAALGAVGGAVNAVSGPLAAGAANYAQLGSSSAAANAIGLSALHGFGQSDGLLGIAAGLTGAKGASNVFGRAQGRFAQFEELARHNIPISDEFVAKMTDVFVEQEKNVEKFRARVGDALGERAVEDGNKEVQRILREIQTTLNGLAGGRH